MANPSDNGQAYIYSLQQLVKSYPQSGFLQALLAHANGAQNLPQAAAYFDAAALHKLINDPASFPPVNAVQVYKQSSTIGLKTYTPQEPAVAEQAEPDAAEAVVAEYSVTDENATVPYVTYEEALAEQATEARIEKDSEESGNAVTEETIVEDYMQAVDEQPVYEVYADDDTSHDIDEPVFEEISEHTVEWHVSPAEQVTANDEEEIVFTPADNEPVAENEEIEDEIYEEIQGIEDFAIAPVTHSSEANNFTFADPLSAEETAYLISESTSTESTDQPAQENSLNIKNPADRLIMGNIAATDYFMFDRAFNRAEESQPAEQVTQAAEFTNTEEDKQDIAPYHDEKMPYSFLWWLDKTRKEHAGIYQPYAVFKPQTSAVVNEGDALQQQYYENIFHLTSVEELDKHTAQNVGFEVKHKGDEIVERFIKEEPQIRPPSSDKLDTENKAKKSAIDSNEMVTETLANIYADQMLYHKAIAIYRKLMLKFPEKSRYFADRIENLEKKTN
jgi:hypothetical protein